MGDKNSEGDVVFFLNIPANILLKFKYGYD